MENQNAVKKDFCRLSLDDFGGKKAIILCGRGGTGKSTAAKRLIADGASALWVSRKKWLSEGLASWFVPPSAAALLPEVGENLGTFNDCPAFRFGDGVVQAFYIGNAPDVRETGIASPVGEFDLIVVDDILPPDGKFWSRRGALGSVSEAQLVEDLRGTAGRSGRIPPILGTCNVYERGDANPYSYLWRVPLNQEGTFTSADGGIIEVRSTAACACTGARPLTKEPEKADYAGFFEVSGVELAVNGRGVRICPLLGRRIYVRKAASESPRAWMNRGAYTPLATRPDNWRSIRQWRQYYTEGSVIFEDFDRQLTFCELVQATNA